MNEQEEFMRELFKEHPIPQESLEVLQRNIMEEIHSSPVNFQEKIQSQRRRLGLIFLFGLSSLSVLFSFVFRFFAPWLSGLLERSWGWMLSNIPLLEKLVFPWELLGLGRVWEVLKPLILTYDVFWGRYGFAIVGILVAGVVFDSLGGDRVITKQ
ncbi:MAG: hypothetical protein GX958_11325 [Desulfitobacterium sp.]|nr:hypothetical protein [Desulfitobacterium sp.]